MSSTVRGSLWRRLRHRVAGPRADTVASELAAIVDGSDDAIIGRTLDGMITTWNGGARRLYGYSATEAIGRPIAILAPPDRVHEIDEITDRIRRGERIAPFATKRVRKDGTLVPVQVSASPIRNARGHLVGAATIARDLTERQDAERAHDALLASEARLRSLIETAVDGIIVIDAAGTIEEFNPAAEQLFGYAAAEVKGRNVRMLMPAPYRDDHDRHLARYQQTRTRTIIGIGRELEAERKDGTVFPVRLSVSEMFVGGRRRFTGIVHDISARVRAERALREQAALARLGEMASVVAHEVKNPLAGVRGAIQVIAKRLPTGGPEALVLNDVVSRLDGLSGLVDDLLRYGRPRPPTLSHVPVLPLLTSTAALVRSDVRFPDVEVTISGTNHLVRADADQLQHALLNLVINAAQAIGDGTIEMSATWQDGFCDLTVRDRGPGIAPELRERVFEPFFTTKSRGTGLGLAIAKRTAEAHGGQILLETEPGQGTSVTIRLPAA